MKNRKKEKTDINLKGKRKMLEMQRESYDRYAEKNERNALRIYILLLFYLSY